MNTQKLEKKIKEVVNDWRKCITNTPPSEMDYEMLRKAITQFIVGCVPEKMKGDGTGFEFTKQLAHNDCVDELERRLTE